MVLTKRHPESVASKVCTIRMAGWSGTGLPSGSANPSITSKERPGSTAVNSQYPADRSPSGPVM